VKRLILNADDFGLTAGVNQAILELNQCGALTSTTLMAKAAATQEACQIARAMPDLGVGCHIVLVDGTPVLPASQLPTLVDQKTGQFRSTLGKFVKDIFLGRIRPEEIEAEAGAQIASLQSAGIHPSHVDTHKHTHMFPTVLKPVLAAAGRHSIRAIRNPFEPKWSLSATPNAPAFRRLQVRILNQFRAEFRRAVLASGLSTSDGAIGVLATGTLDATTLNSLLAAMPDGTWELVTHPGYSDSELAGAGTRLLASRETERTAIGTVHFPPEVELIHFGNL
jgi:hopanoid biosynthesis associated protein HpnK